MKLTLNFPTILTLIRLVLSPLLLPFLFVYLLPFNLLWLNIVLAAVFVFFGLTDFFDGYLARKMQQETTLGTILDPIADKFFVYSTLISLMVINRIYFYWVIILIGREFFVMGLRQVALEHGFSIRVAFWGKVKTLLQMAYITVMIVNPYQHLGFSSNVASCWNSVQTFLLALTLVVSLHSAQRYYASFMKKYSERGKEE